MASLWPTESSPNHLACCQSLCCRPSRAGLRSGLRPPLPAATVAFRSLTLFPSISSTCESVPNPPILTVPSASLPSPSPSSHLGQRGFPSSSPHCSLTGLVKLSVSLTPHCRTPLLTSLRDPPGLGLAPEASATPSSSSFSKCPVSSCFRAFTCVCPRAEVAHQPSSSSFKEQLRSLCHLSECLWRHLLGMTGSVFPTHWGPLITVDHALLLTCVSSMPSTGPDI